MLSTWGRSTGGAGPALDLNLAFPTGGVLDPRITFSRTTNATLTNSAGLVANAPMNLLTFSEQFDNAAWIKSNVTVTANSATAPDGTTTADRLTATASNGEVYQGISITTGTERTSSIWIRRVAGTGTISLYAATTPTDITAQVTSSWSRVSLTSTAGSSTIYSGIRFGTSGDAVEIWGAQLELGSTATTYNPTTVKNLLGYTEHFDNAAWTKSNVSISATKVDDIYGQPFAQQVTSSASNGTVLSTYTAVASTPYTFSIWMKRVTGTGNIDISADGTTWATRTLTTEWQRFSVTASPTAGSKTPGVRIATSGDSIYIFGAQLSDSASVDPYVYQPVAAPSSVAYYGPRFDYDPVTLAPKGLLIEEQRTNLLTYSEQFDNAAWAKSGATVTANFLVSPDGTTTADKLIEDANTGAHLVAQLTTTSAASHALTVYAKAAERTRLILANITAGYSYGFDVSTGTTFNDTYTAGDATATIQSVGNGWYRCSIVGTATAASNNFRILLCDGGISGSYTGNGTSGLFIWGAQLEAGAFATSYIPTVASQVTRAADSASMIGNNFARWYNATQGTLFAQFDTPAAGNRPVLSVGDGTANNMIQLRTEATNPYFRVTTGGVAQVGLDIGTVAANTTYKMTGAYEANNFSACINAGTVGSDASGTVPVVTRMLLGSDQAGSYLNGHISRAAAYGRVLAATEQQGVTA